MGPLFISVLQYCIHSLRITRTMKKSEYNYLVVLSRKIYSIWKSPEQFSTKDLIYFGIKRWVPGNFICRRIEHPKKVFAESFGFRLIPNITVDCIFFNFGKETESISHFLDSILFLNSSRDRSSPGPDLYFASLLSNSVIWL